MLFWLDGPFRSLGSNLQKMMIPKRMVKKSLKSPFKFKIRLSKIYTLHQQNTNVQMQNYRLAHRCNIKQKCVELAHFFECVCVCELGIEDIREN